MHRVKNSDRRSGLQKPIVFFIDLAAGESVTLVDMDIIGYLRNTKQLAHAYLIRTANDAFLRDIKAHIEESILKEKGSPDLFIAEYESLGVDEARALTNYASLKPVGTRKYMIIHAARMTSEAQSALLKAVEEGIGHSVFFFIVKPGISVLPTLLSRVVVLKDDTGGDTEEALGREFLSLGFKDRLAQAEKFGKDSDREGARALVRSLLALAEKETYPREKLRDLLEADQFLQLSGSSPKGVIGHLALVL